MNDCGCCSKEPGLNPLENRPGLPAIAYRLGTYAVFYQRLLDSIAGAKVPGGADQPLAALTTRAPNDPAIALLDAWATVADVLTFYQERIANEGYLRTATERQSVLQLAREIGYELAPGVSATVDLAFTVEEIIGVAPSAGALSAPGPGNSPFNSGVVSIPQGSQIQSVPAPNALPQTFETSEDFEAHVEWNSLQPRLTRPADLVLYQGHLYLLGINATFAASTPGATEIPTDQIYLLNPATILDPSLATVTAIAIEELYLEGTATNLKYGDRLILAGDNQSQAQPEVRLFVARGAEADFTRNETHITFGDNPILPPFQPVRPSAKQLPSGPIRFTAANVNTYFLQNTVTESDLQAFLITSGWDAGDLMAQVNNPPAPPGGENGVFAMRAVSGFYGNNAPLWKSLPNPGMALRADPYPIDWDAANRGKGRTIWTDSQGDAHRNADVLLERSFPQVLPKSWAYFQSPQRSGAFRITGASDQSVADYGLSLKATGLTLDLPPSDRPLLMGPPSVASWGPQRMDAFSIGSDQNLYRRIWNGVWHAPVNLGGGSLSNTPSAVSWGAGRVDAFAIGDEGNLYHWSNDPADSGLQNLGGGYLMNSPTAVSWGAGRLDVFALGFDGVLYHFWNTNLYSTQHWSGPESRGGNNLVNSPVAVSQGPNNLVVFANALDGRTYSYEWANKWTGPEPVGTGQQQEKFQGSPAAVAPKGQALLIFNIASDGKLYLFLYQHSAIWIPWYGQNLTGSPSVVNLAGNPVIFAVGANGDLQQFKVGGQHNDLGGGASLIGSPAGVSREGHLIDVLVSNDFGHVLNFRFNGSTWDTPAADLGGPSVPPFLMRKTTAYLQSEQQALAGLPVTEDIPAGLGSLMLNELVLGLAPGRKVVFTGMRADAPGVVANEILTLNDVLHAGGFTILEFQNGLAYSYQRGSVSINANVVEATNGATVQEVLGNGDASQPNQAFTLKRPPLTCVSASTPNGIVSTLQIKVNNLGWTEASTLYGLGPKDENFTVRLGDDGTPTIAFGQPAARLKTGQQNVRATYRTGIGHAGNVDAGSLSILMTRPPGTRGVVNPLAATGGADPQNLADARENAPLTVLTLDRIVSLDDYESFCQAFAGVGKAQAVEMWSGQTRLVYVTIAAANGDSINSTWPLYATLIQAIDLAHDPVQRFMVAGYHPLVFNLTASVLIDQPRYQAADVMPQVAAALKSTFSFANRSFAQAVTATELITLIQAVPGVIATILTRLYLTGDPSGPHQTEPPPFLAAAPARWDWGVIQPAQLLLLNPLGISLSEMQS